MCDLYKRWPVKFVAPYRVRVWREYYDYHELAETSRRKCLCFAQCRETAAQLKAKHHTGHGVNRVYTEVIDAKGDHVPVQIWQVPTPPKPTA